MNPAQSTPAPGVYIPGYRKLKLLMVLYGAVMLGFGISQLWSPLSLLLTGKKAVAETVAVVKSKEGLPDLVLTNDLAVRSKSETHDRTYIFWNIFRFHTADGRSVEMRPPVGSQLKPLYPLCDEDGLPSETTVFYNPAHPSHAVFPLIISMWFAPGVLCIAGLACIIIGATLYYWANKPIELPHIHPLAAADKTPSLQP